MVGKLMKHELLSLLRSLALLAGAVLLFAILTRIAVSLMDRVSAPMQGLFTFFVVIYYLAAVILCVAPIFCSLSRFYKSLFTEEGYLTFSLPVTATQLILSKFFSAVITSLGCILFFLLSELIATPIRESVIFSDLPLLWESYFGGMGGDPVIIAESILYALFMLPSGFAYLYLIASLGQLFKRNRKLVMVGLYFGVSFVLSSIFFTCAPLFSSSSAHVLMWVSIGIYAAFDVGSFFIVRYILTHKVNLFGG